MGRLVIGDVRGGHLWLGTPAGSTTSPSARTDCTAASASGDGTARLWQAASTSPLVRLLQGGSGSFTAVALGGADLVAAAGVDGTIRLWDAHTGVARGQLSGHAGSVNVVAFGPNGLLASGGDDGTIRLWDMTTLQPVGAVLPATGAVHDVAFSPDGAMVAGAEADGSLQLWDLGTRTLRATLVGHRGTVDAVAFAGNGVMVSAGDDRTIRRWDTRTSCADRRADRHRRRRPGPRGQSRHHDDHLGRRGRGCALLGHGHRRRERAPLTGFRSWVNGIAFSPDGATTASAADDGLQLWDVQNRRPLTSSLTDAGVRVFSVAFSADGLRLAAADKHGVTLYDLDPTSFVPSACHVANRNFTPAEWTSFLGPALPFTPTCP